jgi:hypothetical protein
MMNRLFILLLSLFFCHSIMADVVGVISLATKEVIILAASGEQRPGKTGDSFEHEETIITPLDGKTQLLFKDQMTINLSQNSELKIDEFVFSNDKQQENKLTTSIKKGAFKFISGKISDKNPEGMKVKTPKTQIAIRGTSVLGDVQPEAENIVLLDGAIEVASIDNPAAAQFIDQSGFGVAVDTATGDIAPPQPVDTTSLNTIFKEVNLTETESETSSQAAPAEKAESQKLVSSISKSILEEDDSELNKTFGTKAKEVKTAILKAADTVIAKKEASSSTQKSTGASKTTTSSSTASSSTASSSTASSSTASSSTASSSTASSSTASSSTASSSTASSSTASSSTIISAATVFTASPAQSASTQSISVSVAEVFTTLASQNAEVADAIFKETGSELTNAANVVVTLDVVSAVASGASTPTGDTFNNFTAGRSGTITHTFSNLSLTATEGTGSASLVGVMEIDIDAKTFETYLNGSGDIGGASFNLNDSGKYNTWGDGDNIANDGSVYTLLNDTISDLRFEFADWIALGGSRASMDIYYTADDYPLGNKDFASMTVDIYTKDGFGTIVDRIEGTEQITPSR